MIDNRLNIEVPIDLSLREQVVQVLINFSFVHHERERLQDELPAGELRDIDCVWISMICIREFMLTSLFWS